MDTKFAPLRDVVDLDAYQWLQSHAPYYISAIQSSLSQGASPADIRQFISINVGTDRQGLALRCEQAARHIKGLDGE
ncbi:MAG: hypothetical protein AAF702_44515 [Chloroflexota bacterium]